MIESITFVGALFFVGGLAMLKINVNKNESERKANWLKFFSYFCIQSTLLVASISTEFITLLGFSAIAILCSIELFNSYRQQTGKWTVYLMGLTMTLALIGLVGFSQTLMEYQLFCIILVAIFDSFSQLIGQLFGRKKLIPTISPNKTIIGFLGGLIFLTISIFPISLWLNLPLQFSLPLGFGIALFALIGDLLASFVKRCYGIKDFSNWLPGQGGFMDRFDSLSFAASFTLLYVNLFLS